MQIFLLPTRQHYERQEKAKNDEIMLMFVPVKLSAGHSGGLAGSVLGPNHNSRPHTRGVGLFTPSPHLPSRAPSRGRRGRPTQCPEGSAGSLARAQHQHGPGVFPAKPTRVSQRSSTRGPAQLASAPAPPFQALLTWSWPKARSAAVTPASPTGTSVNATDETLPRARGVPEPRKAGRLTHLAGE